MPMKRRSFLQQIAGVMGGTSLAPRLAMASLDDFGPKASGPIHIGSDKQLFIDEMLIDNAERVQLVVNRPTLHTQKCIVPDRPWEGFGLVGYNSVMEENGVLKMWYDAMANDGTRWSCYATSSDGMHWDVRGDYPPRWFSRRLSRPRRGL
jgi:hypothetical protein